MNDVDARPDGVDTRRGHGNIVVGAMLILTGVAIMLDRAGVLQWRNQWTLWPLILGGIGLARFLQSVPGEPKQGLLFLAAAVWLLLGEAGWVSLADSWPIAVIVFGLIVALNGGRRRRHRWHIPDRPDEPGDPHHLRRLRLHERPLSGLAMLGIWIAIVVAVQVSGIRSFDDTDSSSDRVRVVSVMGRSEHTIRDDAFRGADVTNVMGRSEIDLRVATLAAGANADVRLFSAMGSVILRVPPAWTVDAGAVSAFGGVRDERAPAIEAESTRDAPRDPSTGPAPRLVLRGVIMFGRLTITS